MSRCWGDGCLHINPFDFKSQVIHAKGCPLKLPFCNCMSKRTIHKDFAHAWWCEHFYPDSTPSSVRARFIHAHGLATGGGEVSESSSKRLRVEAGGGAAVAGPSSGALNSVFNDILDDPVVDAAVADLENKSNEELLDSLGVRTFPMDAWPPALVSFFSVNEWRGPLCSVGGLAIPVPVSFVIAYNRLMDSLVASDVCHRSLRSAIDRYAEQEEAYIADEAAAFGGSFSGILTPQQLRRMVPSCFDHLVPIRVFSKFDGFMRASFAEVASVFSNAEIGVMDQTVSYKPSEIVFDRNVGVSHGGYDGYVETVCLNSGEFEACFSDNEEGGSTYTSPTLADTVCNVDIVRSWRCSLREFGAFGSCPGNVDRFSFQLGLSTSLMHVVDEVAATGIFSYLTRPVELGSPFVPHNVAGLPHPYDFVYHSFSVLLPFAELHPGADGMMITEAGRIRPDLTQGALLRSNFGVVPFTVADSGAEQARELLFDFVEPVIIIKGAMPIDARLRACGYSTMGGVTRPFDPLGWRQF